MNKYFFKIVYRAFLRNKLNSFINIFGLAIGLTSFILISLYVNFELNWDTYHKNHERTFLLNQVRTYSGQKRFFNRTPVGLAFGLKEQIPEIENAACIKEIWAEILSSSKDKTFVEEYGFYADSSIFKILSYEFIYGDPNSALSNSNSIVLTESLANKHFDTSDVLGKIIKMDNRTYSVSAVIKDLPFNTHFPTSYFVSLSIYGEKAGVDIYSDWEKTYARTFIQVKDPKEKSIVSEKAAKIINGNISESEKHCSVLLQPISEVHLDKSQSGYFYMMVIYGVLGFLILILAAINFLNLSTALSSIRTKEIGVKKVLGCKRFILTRQFLAESLLNSMIALILAFGIAEFLLPLFRIMTERILVINYISDWRFILYIVGSTAAIGLFAGLYPSLYLSRLNPLKVLKSGIANSKKSKRFSGKKVLITFQLVISMAFVIGTTGFFATINYITNMDVVFEREGVLFAEIDESKNLSINSIEALRGEFLQIDDIENVAISLHVPFYGYSMFFIDFEGAGENQKIHTAYNRVGDQFLETYKIPIIKGRNISNNLVSDSSACVVSETFIKKVGWDEPIGKKIKENKYTIVGVFKDFHMETPLDPINPNMLVLHNGNLDNQKKISFKLKPGYSKRTVEFINEKLHELFPDNHFKIKFIEDIMYNENNRMLFKVAQTMMYFTCIAILIALVGLFSLLSFSLKRKVKEIGIRKIMGASVKNIYFYLSKEFIVLLIISNIIAVPLGIKLLGAIPFAYTPEFSIIPIIIIVITSFIVTLGTISYWVLKTARANPVDSLRYE